MFLSANAGKRSLALSLRDPRGAEALLRLAGRADVLLQSLRPGLAEELGLGPDAVRARNPGLVYCTVGAYGHVGPLAREPGYDADAGGGGLISITGEPGRRGVRVGASLIDQGTGTWAALGVLAALLERERTGEGASSTSRCTRPRSGTSATTSPATSRTDRPDGRGDPLPDGGALRGDGDTRRRADGGRRQRPSLSGDLRRRRAPAPRRRRALPDEPRPGAKPRRADDIARVPADGGGHRDLARAAHRGRRPRRACRERPRRRRVATDRRSGSSSTSSIPGSPT